MYDTPPPPDPNALYAYYLGAGHKLNVKKKNEKKNQVENH